jgi:hypothetical protein
MVLSKAVDNLIAISWVHTDPNEINGHTLPSLSDKQKKIRALKTEGSNK